MIFTWWMHLGSKCRSTSVSDRACVFLSDVLSYGLDATTPDADLLVLLDSRLIHTMFVDRLGQRSI